MVFRAPREKMERCIAIAKSIIASKPQMPVLANVLLETENNRIIVTATDLEVGIRTSFEASVDEQGSITINGSKFLGVILQLPHEEINVEVDPNNDFKVRSLNSLVKAKFTLKGVPRENYPSLPVLEPSLSRFSIAQGILKEMIKKTIFAISTETSRQYLNGVFFESLDGKLRLVSTDGRRLALVDRDCEITSALAMRLIVPQKVLYELSHTLDDEGLVDIAFSDNQIFFSFGDSTYVSNLIDGTFPNYNQVIPKKQEKLLRIGKDMFTNALNRSSLLTDERQNNQVRFDFSSNHAVVSVNNADTGSYRDELPVEYTGEPLEIAFNIKFLKDYLKEVASEEVVLEMNTPLSPVSIRMASDTEYIYVVMPMKVNA
jgi:DNA polymerase-3 subunit beta